MFGELNAELAGLRPAHGADNRADADDVDRQTSGPARPASSHSTSAPIAEMLRRRISVVTPFDCRDGAPHQTMARFADALIAFGFDARTVGQLTRFFGLHRLAEDIALDLADAEFADQVEIVVGLDAFGGRVHVQALGQATRLRG